MQIRSATEDDIWTLAAFRVSFVAEIRGVDESSLPDSFVRSTVESHQRGFAAGRLRAWVAIADGDVVGVVTALVDEVPPRPEDDRVLQAFVTNLYVRLGYRGKGVGRRLMRVCIDDAAQSGVRALGLHTTADGRKLYESLGFRGQPSWLELAVDQL